MKLKCINIHDYQSPTYKLTNEYDGRRAVVKNFFMLLESYQNHPEAKSLAPDGKPCEFDTRGLLQRAHIVANWPPIYIGMVPKREFMRRGINQHTLEKICKRVPVRTIKLLGCLRALEEYEVAPRSQRLIAPIGQFSISAITSQRDHHR